MLNVHPLLVHFPIALLTIYAPIEIISASSKKYEPSLRVTKFILLFLGTLSAWITLSSGELIEEAFEGNQLVEVHSLFANITIWIFTILAVSYVWQIGLAPLFKQKDIRLPLIVTKSLNLIASTVLTRPLTVVLTFMGLLFLMVTGALGGAIVYGPNIDPFVSFIYRLVSPLL